jgi:Rrf2 family protein
MTVFFSKSCELGIQAVLFLSAKDMRIYTSEEVSKELKVPKEFVSKVMQILTNSGIVGSKKGKSGGFFLAKKPSEIKLIDIVEAIDGLDVFKSCILGFPGCSVETPCPVHNKWGKLRDEAFKMLSKETLANLREKTVNKLASL